MGNTKEIQRLRIIEAAQKFLSEPETDGDLYDAYLKLIDAKEFGDGEQLASDYVNVCEPFNEFSVNVMIQLIENNVDNDIPEFFMNIDWKLLAEQKQSLLKVIEDCDNVPVLGHLEGILNMIDSLQDYAADDLGFGNAVVFPYLGMEDFAREQAEEIFQNHIEGTFLYDAESNEGMSEEFVKAIVDDSVHMKAIKERMYQNIMIDLKLNPDTFKRDADGNLVYDSTMYDYGFAIKAYCKEILGRPIVHDTGIRRGDKTIIKEGDSLCTHGLYIGNVAAAQAFAETVKDMVYGSEEPQNIWGEIRDEHEEDDIVFIDAWVTPDDNEEGKTIAKVNKVTKEIQYIDVRARTDKYAQEMIKEVLRFTGDPK